MVTPAWPEYALLDSGAGRKLERFGERLIVRAEPKAWWQPALPASAWKKAAAVCDSEGNWSFARPLSPDWLLRHGPLTLQARFTQMSKHVGVFPEQSPYWDWIAAQGAAGSRPAARLLSLFGYTGAASLAAAAAGFSVTHVDASKPALSWAKQNQVLSGLEKAPVRWILDDALKFVQREGRRGSRYDALILDPPAFGRGPKQEVWKVEKSLPLLLKACREVLSERPRFVILTMYAIEASALMIGNLLGEMMADFAGDILLGELALAPENGANVLPLSIFGRWHAAEN